MLFKLQHQYDLWISQRKPTDKFSWGHTTRSLGTPIEYEEKLFKDMDDEEKEAAFRREVFRVIHKHLF